MAGRIRVTFHFTHSRGTKIFQSSSIHEKSPPMFVIAPILSILLIAICAPVAGSVASQSATEQQIVSHIDANHDSAVALLRRLVNTNSGTMNFDGVAEVGSILRAEFDALGFATSWVDGSSFDRAGHLVATKDGSGPRLLLIGHLDTVFEPDSPFQDWEDRGDSIIGGPGIADMKGGDVIIVQALKALEAVGALDAMSITVVMTGDEEKSGRPLNRARQALIDAADAADIAIGFENGDNNPMTAVVARRGSTGWRLEVSGRPAHSSQILQPEVGAGAIYEASRILNQFYERLSGERYLTFNPGVMLGGTDVTFDAEQARGSAFGKGNVVSEHTIVSGDLRAISPEQLQSAKDQMRAIVGEHLPHTRAEIIFDDGYPPLAPSPGNERLLSILNEVSQDLGLGAMTGVDPRNAGAADVSFVAGRVEMAIDGLGLTGGDDHTVEEFADLRLLSVQAKRAAVLMLRLTRMTI